LRRHGDADGMFKIEAYCYFLPTYLIAALTDAGAALFRGSEHATPLIGGRDPAQ